MNDTIFALSTPPGRGAIAIIRLSGPDAFLALNACFLPKHGKIIPRRMTYGQITDGDDTIDEVMAVFLPAPSTYTREDMVELQCHGSPVVVHAILQLLSSLPLNLRAADPGEFTRRAFENGRLDLSEAEAVMDLLKSESEQAAKTALRQLRGAISSKIQRIIDLIVLGMASIEAGIDFPEDDWEREANENGFVLLQQALAAIEVLGDSYRSGRLIQDGIRIAIVGRPNVGKSSLLNALAGFERALVSEEAGTTRDVVEHAISYRGMAVRLLDTAGMRLKANPLEQRGMALGSRQLETADIAVFIVDGSEALNDDDAMAASLLSDIPVIAAINKSDLPQVVSQTDVLGLCPNAVAVQCLSAQQGEGVEDLLSVCLNALDLSSEQSECITSARHAQSLKSAKELLTSAIAAYKAGLPADVAVLDARAAMQALGEITGETLSDSVIDTIFSTFCIGK